MTPKPPHHEIEMRWRKRKRLTAIAGFTCADGVVIAAETEESYADNKVYTHKLFPYVRTTWRLGIAGAGTGYLIDYARDKIVESLDSGSITNTTEFHKSVATTLTSLYQNEFKVCPIKARHIQLLVAVQFNNPLDSSKWTAPALFECQSNLVTRVKQQQSRVLGTGELVKELGVQFADWGLTADLAEWACVYVIHDAKRRYGGVGGKTHTFRMMNDGNFVDRVGSHVPRIEMVFENMTRVNLLMALSLAPSLLDSKSRDFIDAGKRWFGHARKEVLKIEKERGQLKHTKVVIHDRAVRKMLREVAKRSTSQTSDPEK